MTNRERFFAVLEGTATGRTPFFPDISTWFQASRLGVGTEQPYFPGQYIPDDAEINLVKSRLTSEFTSLGYADFYRRFDWGLPAHVYNWYEEEYQGGVEKEVDTADGHRTVTFHTPKGDLTRTYKLDAEGTWSEYGHMVKRLEDLEIVRSIVENTKWITHPERIERFLHETADFGVCDIVVFRSPFGKLIHEYMGFENVAYALFDDEPAVVDFMKFQETWDLRFIELAATMPGSIIIISDHADENLISPPWYRRYCVPFYQKACKIIHGAGKYASTHLDGNFKGYFDFIGESGFDLLDGCTPAPMFNYEPEELAATVRRVSQIRADGGGPALNAYCGVPSGLFTFGVAHEQIADFGVRIADAFGGRVIVNVGDILPPLGDIGAVIALGERVSPQHE
ncbi:MAG TPA: uroporphyrinogen decarboxylase family protein [Spirochaetia bacterium]|nr:uroporphyrinogen decarboxylase family protein [Spirochaetia bacterium]